MAYKTNSTPYIAYVTQTGPTTLNVKLFRKQSSGVDLEELPDDSVSISSYSIYIPCIGA
jgi:hypothetical protein